MKKTFYIFLFAIIGNTMSADFKQSAIDTVVSYHWGTGQNSGQGEEYFPMNIFGKPDTSASDKFQSSDPKEICSIGLGGEIVVGFKNFEIVDGPGPDFTIFENAFINPINNKVFAEPAVVSVSMDGINFYEFPFDSLTLNGCAGITPTNGKEDCFDTLKSGGDRFDLASIGLTRAKYIRIKDITNLLLSNPEHPYYDPILSGFDLDAVVGLNLERIEATDVNEKNESQLKITVTGNTLHVKSQVETSSINLYNLSGHLIETEKASFAYFSNLQKGVYLIVVFTDRGKVIRKKIII